MSTARAGAFVVAALSLAAMAAVGALPAAPAPPLASGASPGLEGSWRLVEQHYESGRSDLLGDGPTMWLVFAREGPTLTCRIRVSEPQTVTFDWPALLIGGTPRPLKLEQRVIDAAAGRAVARYTSSHTRGDGETLSIVEEYALSDDGKSLLGTVTVGLREDGEDRGSYLLRRRFEREP